MDYLKELLALRYQQIAKEPTARSSVEGAFARTRLRTVLEPYRQ